MALHVDSFLFSGSECTEITPDREGRERADRHAITIREDVQFLMLTVTADGERGYTEPPSRMRFQMIPPDQRPLRAENTASIEGQTAFLIERPLTGEWTIAVEQGERADFKIVVTSIVRRAKKFLKRMIPGSCQACKKFMKAFLLYILVHAATPVVAPLVAFKAKIVAAMAELFLASKAATTFVLDGILSLLSMETPLDRTIEWACRQIRWCP